MIDFLLNNTLWGATDLWLKNTKSGRVTIGKVLGRCFSTGCASIYGSDTVVICAVQEPDGLVDSGQWKVLAATRPSLVVSPLS